MRSIQKITALSFFALTVVIAPAALAENAGQYVDDAALTTKVKTQLIADKNINAAGNISVTTTNGVVELTGTTVDRNQEAEAVRTAEQVNGVKSVKDSLTAQQ